jgi:hypothetical protein
MILNAGWFTPKDAEDLVVAKGIHERFCRLPANAFIRR